jgi:sporulation protein YlmC with PRC-barrel domain
MENGDREFQRIWIKNIKEESRGRVTDLGLDLVDGRIVEMLVDPEGSLVAGPRISAAPQRALVSDPPNEALRHDASTCVIKSARAIDLSKWLDSGRSHGVAAANRIFEQEPYFLEEGEMAGKSANRRKLLFDSVERSRGILRLLVGNLRNQQSGELYAMTLDIPNGRIRSFVVLAPGYFEPERVVTAMASHSNAGTGLSLSSFADSNPAAFPADPIGNSEPDSPLRSAGMSSPANEPSGLGTATESH